MKTIFCNKSEKPIKKCFRHQHNSWEIIIQISGESTTKIADGKYLMKVGDILIIPPFTPHENYAKKEYTDAYIQAEGLDFDGITLSHDEGGYILTLIDILIRIMTEKENDYQIIADSILETIVKLIKKQLNSSNSLEVQKLKNILYDNISNPNFSFKETAEKLGYNKDYICRKFKKEMQTTPIKYLLNMRIEKAKDLLRTKNFETVSNIAYEVGFNDPFYFSYFFKKTVGKTPVQFRTDV